MNKDTAANPSSSEILSDSSDTATQLINRAESKLKTVETLLLDPEPPSIPQVTELLDETATCISDLEYEFRNTLTDQSAGRQQAVALQSTLRRIRALLGGALRLQWNRMRRTGLYIETYTSGGKSKVCIHPNPRVKLEV